MAAHFFGQTAKLLLLLSARNLITVFALKFILVSQAAAYKWETRTDQYGFEFLLLTSHAVPLMLEEFSGPFTRISC